MLILLLISFKVTCGQQLIYCGEIGSFNSANSFCMNPAGILFVADAGSNEVIKLDTLGKVIRVIGGYGWGESSFDYPSDIFANTLNVYVADKNNDRIQIFDKDLNFLSVLSTSEYKNEKHKFRYPTGIGVSTQGDLFILDFDNTRILKFNFRGEFLTEIGGYESGNYALLNPKKFALSPAGKIIVLDPPFLIFFDNFGNNLNKTKLELEAENINSTLQAITISSQDKVEYFSSDRNNLYGINLKTCIPNIEKRITDALLHNNKLYLLTDKTIFIFQINE